MKKLILLVTLAVLWLPMSAQVTAGFTYSGTTCTGSTISFSNTSTGATTYDWDFGDFNTATSANPTHSYIFSNTFEVRLIASDGSSADTAIQFIHIKGPSNANFFFNKFDGIYCVGSEVGLNNTSNDYNSLLWDFGDGGASILHNPTHTWPNAKATYNVKLITVGTCGNDTVTKVLEFDTASHLIPSTWMLNTPRYACPRELIEFGNFTNYEDTLYYDFGDGNTDPGPTAFHSYDSLGTYLVTLNASNQCGTDTDTHTVVVSNTNANNMFIGMSPFFEACPGQPVTISSFNPLNSYVIDYGDGNIVNTSTLPIDHSYSTKGTYDIEVIGFTSCGASDTVMRTIDIVDSTFANVFGFVNPATSCPGESINIRTFGQGMVNFHYDLGDGTTFSDSSGAEFSHSFATAGTYDITIVGESYCGIRDTFVRVYTVGNRPASAWFTTSSPFSGICYNSPVDFNPQDPAGTHHWDFGDGNTSTSASPTHTYGVPGYYTVVHTITNTCGNTDAYARTVHLIPGANPTANFSVTPELACKGDSIMLRSTSFFNTNVTHQYDMGDGNTVSTTKDTAWYVYSTSGNYSIVLTDSNGCGGDTDEEFVTIADDPTASFTMQPTNPNALDTVWFTFTGSGSIGQIWSFGTQGTGAGENPYFIFPDQGTKVITVTATSPAGCTSAHTETLEVGPPAGVREWNKVMSIYPNPASTALHIEGIKSAEWSITDLQGRSIANGSINADNSMIDVSEFVPGFYFLNLKEEKRTSSHLISVIHQ